MKKSLSLVLCSLIILSAFSMAFTLAEEGSSDDSVDSVDDSSGSGSGEDKTESEIEIKEEDDGRIKIEQKIKTADGEERIKIEMRENGEFRQEIRQEIRGILEQDMQKKIAEFRIRLRASNGTLELDKTKVKIEGFDEDEREIIVGKINARTGLNLTVEDIENGTSRGEILRAYLSNGARADVKVLPDRAAAIAVERLRAKCEERNCTVELKEVGSGNSSRAAYVVQTEKEARAFLIFKRKMIVSAEVDSETGEIINVRKPWWAFLANEIDESAEEEAVEEIEVESEVEVEEEGVGIEVEAETELEIEDGEEITQEQIEEAIANGEFEVEADVEVNAQVTSG